jgi:pimeloyl-ACP methyl ester carboxylesterase
MPQSNQPTADGMVAARGLQLHYREWSSMASSASASPVPLVLLHGLASTAHIWDLVAPLLADEHRVVALDQRGHGLSDKPDDGYAFASIVADDIAALDALQVGGRCAVVGHSWGANVALELAAAHPDRVAALALVDGGFGMLRQRPGATWETISQELAPPEFAGTPRATYLRWMREEIPDWRPELEEIVLQIVHRGPDDTVGPYLARANHMRILRAMWDQDAEALFPAVRAPVLYVLAVPKGANPDEDRFYAAKLRGIATAERLLSRAPLRAVEWMRDTIHDIPLQRPEALTNSIARFLRELDL